MTGPAARPERPHVHPLSYVGFSLVLSVLLFVFFLAGDRGFLQVRKQRAQAGALQAEVTAINARNEALEKEVALLTEDPAAVEKIAREDLQLVAPRGRRPRPAAGLRGESDAEADAGLPKRGVGR